MSALTSADLRHRASFAAAEVVGIRLNLQQYLKEGNVVYRVEDECETVKMECPKLEGGQRDEVNRVQRESMTVFMTGSVLMVGV